MVDDEAEEQLEEHEAQSSPPPQKKTTISVTRLQFQGLNVPVEPTSRGLKFSLSSAAPPPPEAT